MADGNECIHCGYQETVHKYPQYADEGYPVCKNYDDGGVDPLTLPPSDPCSCYPNCPTTTDVVQVGVTQYDEESNSNHSSFTKVELCGPCMGNCRVKEEEERLKKPLNHAVWMLFLDPKAGRIFEADIGS